MKRLKFIGHLTENGCLLYREGGNHTLYYNPVINKVAAVPRHSDIPEILCKEICKQLEIPKIK
jgi:mRNA interferase HicA